MRISDWSSDVCSSDLRVTTPQQMLELGEAGLKEHIKTIGLYNAKAKNVIALSQLLIADHGGAVPRDRESLERLAGVGRKTANVVRSEEHTSELQSLMRISYAVFCLKKKSKLLHSV